MTGYPCAFCPETFETREARDEHTREADGHYVIDPTGGLDDPVEW